MKREVGLVRVRGLAGGLAGRSGQADILGERVKRVQRRTRRVRESKSVASQPRSPWTPLKGVTWQTRTVLSLFRSSPFLKQPDGATAVERTERYSRRVLEDDELQVLQGNRCRLDG